MGQNARMRWVAVAVVVVVVVAVSMWRCVGDGGAGAAAPGSVEDRVARLKAWGREHRGELVRDLAALVRLRSVAADPDGLDATAQELTRRFEALGMTVQTVSVDGPPLLLVTGGAFQPEKPAPTLMLYAHYDGQAVDPARWTAAEPFEPTLYAGPFAARIQPASLDDDAAMDQNWRLYGRAAADDKGPIAVVLAVLEGVVEADVGPLSVRLAILLDGEEESGSPHLGASLAEHADQLRADAVVSLDGPSFPTGDPTIYFGVRGIASVDLTTYGARSDLHSGHYGNWAGNPALELAWILGTMKDPKTGEVKVDGFADCRRPLSPAQKEALAAIPAIDDDLRDALGVVRTESRWSLAEAITHPSLNVRGLAAGDVGTQARTIVPAKAQAAIDMRLVPDCDRDHVVGALRAHLDKLGYVILDHDPTDDERRENGSLIRLDVRSGGYRGVRSPLEWEVSQRLVAAVTDATGQTPVRIPNLGGSLPFYHFEDHLGVRTLGLPLVNHDNNQHAPDENVRLGNLWRGFDILAHVLLGEQAEAR